MVERLVRNEKVSGSIPLCSIFRPFHYSQQVPQARPGKTLENKAWKVRKERIKDHHPCCDRPGIPDQSEQDSRDLRVVSRLSATGFRDEITKITGVSVLEFPFGKSIEPRRGIGEKSFP